MRCEDVQVELHSYLCDEVEPETRSAVAQHLATCGRCSQEANAVKGLGDLLSQGLKEWIDDGVCPPDLARRIEVHIGGNPRASWWKDWRLPAGAVAAAAVFVVLVLTRPEFSDQLAAVPLLGVLADQLNPPDFHVALDSVDTRESLVKQPGKVVAVNTAKEAGGITLKVDSVEFGAAGTRVQYSLAGLTLRPGTAPRQLGPTLSSPAGLARLHSFTADQRKNEIVFQAYFDPVAPGQTLTLAVTNLPVSAAESVRWVLTREHRAAGPAGPQASVVAWEQKAGSAEVTVEWPVDAASRLGDWTATDDAGKAYQVTEGGRTESGGTMGQRLTVSAPEGTGTVTLSAGWVERRLPGPWHVSFSR